mgnify:CR=1 FL=1
MAGLFKKGGAGRGAVIGGLIGGPIGAGVGGLVGKGLGNRKELLEGIDSKLDQLLSAQGVAGTGSTEAAVDAQTQAANAAAAAATAAQSPAFGSPNFADANKIQSVMDPNTPTSLIPGFKIPGEEEIT